MKARRLLPRLLLFIVAGLLFQPASSGPQSAGPGLAPGQTMTPLSDGRSLILGGWGSGGAMRTAIMYDPRSSRTTKLAPLSPARAWHSATVLPDGTVLILGGIGSNRQPMAEPHILDPADGTVQRFSIPRMTPRAHHTVTLLTDGRVLIAGGNDASGNASAAAEIWTQDTGALDTITMSAERSGHTATLLSDGRVLLWAGTDALIDNGEIFDPETASFSRITTIPSEPHAFDPPRLEASVPSTGTADVPLDSSIALRFSKPLRMIASVTRPSHSRDLRGRSRFASWWPKGACSLSSRLQRRWSQARATAWCSTARKIATDICCPSLASNS